MKPFKPTILFIVAIIVLIAVYDIWAVVTGGGDRTISATILTFAKAYPIIPFTFGIFMGHLFFHNDPVGYMESPEDK
jgi:hypothetical protein